MKKVILILIIMVMSSSFSMKADNQSQSNNGNVVLLHSNSAHKRPNTPSMLSIECNYGEGYITFILPENIYTLTFHIYNHEEETVGMITSEHPISAIPSLHGEYSIKCVDDGNRTYCGTLNFL